MTEIAGPMLVRTIDENRSFTYHAVSRVQFVGIYEGAERHTEMQECNGGRNCKGGRHHPKRCDLWEKGWWTHSVTNGSDTIEYTDDVWDTGWGTSGDFLLTAWVGAEVWRLDDTSLPSINLAVFVDNEAGPRWERLEPRA